jgi:hypothetical protein
MGENLNANAPQSFLTRTLPILFPLHLRVWQNFLRPLDSTMDQNRRYAPGARVYLILSPDPDRYQLFDNIYSRVVRPPAKKGGMKFIPLLSLSVRCPLWLDFVTVTKALSAQMLHWYCFFLMYIVLYCARYQRHATLPLTNTAILANVNNWRFLQKEEQIPAVCNLYGGRTLENIT